MAISDKDQKILWARAAGRCSMYECRTQLTLDPKNQAAATLGEMCHIIGKEDGSARSNSPLSVEDRDRYANLILLCRHHHVTIDRDVLRYPVEVLHQIKVRHELWVEERLGGTEEDPTRRVISTWIDAISEALHLAHWDWLIEHAVTDMVHQSIWDARGTLNKMSLATVWPGVQPELEASMQALAEALDTYLCHFETKATARGDFMVPDKSYAQYVNPRYHEEVEALERWSHRNYSLLIQLVIALNRFVDIVRRDWNPLYFVERGRFLLIDSMGYRVADGALILPDEQYLAEHKANHDPDPPQSG